MEGMCVEFPIERKRRHGSASSKAADGSFAMPFRRSDQPHLLRLLSKKGSEYLVRTTARLRLHERKNRRLLLRVLRELALLFGRLDRQTRGSAWNQDVVRSLLEQVQRRLPHVDRNAPATLHEGRAFSSID